jgi:tripartite-type tricarboxylate transporter receptor subunit TctC
MKIFANWVFLLITILSLSDVKAASPDNFPNRPLKILVPFSSGSGADHASRFFGDQLAKVLQQPILIENKPGAGGILAVTALKNAPPDGYTLLMASNSLMAVNPILVSDLSYDPEKDLRPIGGLTKGVNVIVVAAQSPFKSLGDLIAYAKSQTFSMNAGTYAGGYQLALAWLGSVAGVKFENISYKGAGEIFVALLGNQLDFAIVSFNGAIPLLKSGKFRALAISGDERNQDFPDIPTVAESGYPEFKNYTWTSFYVRGDTSNEVVQVLADGLKKVMAGSAAQAYVNETMVELMPFDPQAMRTYQLDEIARFKGIAKEAKIVPN